MSQRVLEQASFVVQAGPQQAAVEQPSYTQEFDLALNRELTEIAQHCSSITAVILFGSLAYRQPRIKEGSIGILKSDVDLLVIVSDDYHGYSRVDYDELRGGFSPRIPNVMLLVISEANLIKNFERMDEALTNPDSPYMGYRMTFLLQAIDSGIVMQGSIPTIIIERAEISKKIYHAHRMETHHTPGV